MQGDRLDGANVTVRSGEIVGLAGLLGSGRTEVARAVFGADPARWRAARSRQTRALEVAAGRDPGRVRALLGGPQGGRHHPLHVGAREPDAGGAAGALPERDRRPRRAAADRRSLHRPAGDQDVGSRADDPRALRRQPAEGAAGALAVPQPVAAGARRADARHRRRRQSRDPGADRRACRQRARCADDLFGAGGDHRGRGPGRRAARRADGGRVRPRRGEPGHRDARDGAWGRSRESGSRRVERVEESSNGQTSRRRMGRRPDAESPASPDEP